MTAFGRPQPPALRVMSDFQHTGAPTVMVGSCDRLLHIYQYNLSANCIWRGVFSRSPLLVKWPKLCDCKLPDPVPNRTRLKTLKASARKSRRICSWIGKLLATEMFSL